MCVLCSLSRSAFVGPPVPNRVQFVTKRVKKRVSKLSPLESFVSLSVRFPLQTKTSLLIFKWTYIQVSEVCRKGLGV